MVSVAEPTMRVQPRFVFVGDGRIQQCPETAVTRVPAEHVCHAVLQSIPHIMPVSAVDREEDEYAADLLVYHQIAKGEAKYVYVHAWDVKRAAGECRMKPLNFDRSAELEAEYAAAEQILKRERVR